MLLNLGLENKMEFQVLGSSKEIKFGGFSKKTHLKLGDLEQQTANLDLIQAQPKTFLYSEDLFLVTSSSIMCFPHTVLQHYYIQGRIRDLVEQVLYLEKGTVNMIGFKFAAWGTFLFVFELTSHWNAVMA